MEKYKTIKIIAAILGLSCVIFPFTNALGYTTIPITYLVTFIGISIAFSAIVAIIDYKGKGKQALIYGIIATLIIIIGIIITNSKIQSVKNGDQTEVKNK